jgi:DNA (cytosine-5)-methyltransferase 1
MEAAGLSAGELTGLIGGPPCQGFSTIGRRHTDDPRNNLFGKFFELVAATEPLFFVAENVLGILDDIYDRIREAAFAQISGVYTVLEPMKLKASDYGAPTTRERAFFVGFRKKCGVALSTQDFVAARVESTPTVESALAGLPERIRCDWISENQGWREVTAMLKGYFGERVAGFIPDGVGDQDSISRYRDFSLVSGCLGTRHTPAVKERFARLKPGKQDKISKAVRLRAEGYCPTLRAGTGADRGSYQAIRPVHPTSPRVITPREAARLQGFPDWFRFAPSKWHSFRQIGNSVSPLVAEAVLKVIASGFHQISAAHSDP